MDILQDIVVGSVGGLAIRGLKRLILGRRTDTTTQQIGDLRARIQQQQIIIDSLQDNLQVVLGSKRSAEEFEEDNAHVPKRQKLELTNSPHQEIQREIVSHPLISLTQTNSEISHDSEPSNLLQIEAPNPVNRKEETSKSESESDESDSSESESSESDSSDSESSESSSESDESSGDSLTSEESSSSEESEFSSEKSDSSEESSDESSEGSESEESSEDIGQLPSRKYSSVSKNSEEESSDQELKGKSNEDRIASLSGLEYPELANEDLWEAPQNRRIVSIRRVPRLDSNLGSNVLGLSEPPYGRSRSVSENRSGPIRVRDYTHSIPRMTGYVSRDSYQRSRSRSMSRSLSRSRSQSLRSESRSRSVSRSYSRSVSRSRSPRPMSNLEDSQKSASQTPSKLSLKSHENEVQEEKNQTSEGHWTIGTSNQGGHKSYAFPNYEDPEEFTPHISAPSLPSQSRENSPSVSLRSKSKSENSTLLPENSEISQPREISREISPLFPSPNPPIPDIPSENLESESSPAPPEFSEGSSIPKSSRSKSYAEERELLRQEEIQWQEAEHEVSRLCEREKSLSDQTGSVLERGRKVLELPWPKSLRNSQNSAGVIEQGEFSSPRITPAYCNLIPSYTPEYSEFGLNPVTYSPYTSPACGTPYRPCYVTKPYHPYDTELGLYETCRYSGHGGAYEGGMQRTNNYGRGLNWLTHIPSPPKLSPYQAPEINLTEEEEEEDEEEEEEVEEEGGEEEDEEEKEEEEEMEEEQNEGSEIRQKSPSATPSGLDIPYNQEKSESYQPQNEANSGESPRSGLENQQTNFEAETDLQAGNEDEEYSEKAESELQDSPEPQLDDPQPKFQVSPQSAVIEEEDRVYDIGEFNLAPEEENQAEYEPRLCTAKHRFESQTTMTPTGISRQNGLEQFGLEDDLNEDEGESKRQNEPDLSQNKEKEFGQTEKWDEEEFVPSEQEKEDPIYTENEDEGPELESSDSDSMSLGGESYKEEFDENFFYEEGMSSESEDCSIAQSGWETSLNHSVSYDDSYLEKYEQYKEVSSKDQKDQSKPSWDEVFPQIEDDLEPEILETNPAVQEPRSSDFQIPTQKFRFFAPQPHDVLDDGFPAHNVQKSFAGSIVPNVLDEARILDQFNVLDNETPEQNEFDASQEEKNNFARGRLPDWSQSPEQSLEDEDKANNGEEIESQPSPDRNNPFSELARQEDESAGGREETFGGPPKALSWLERGLERGVRGLGARLERLGRYLGDRQEGASNLDAQYDKHEVCRPLHHQRHTLGVTHWDPSNRHDKFYRRGRKFGHKHSKYHHKFSGNDHRQGNRRQRTHTGHQSWDDFQMFPPVEATSGDIVDASSEPNLEDDGFQILSVRNSPFPIRPQNFPSSIVHPVIDLTDDSS